MQIEKITVQSIERATIKILLEKGQWRENETKIHVTYFETKDCLMCLIEISSISSTMVLSQNWPKQYLTATQKPTVFAFRADQQLQGRGQRQNSWESPSGNLYLTLLFKLQFSYFPYLPIIAVSNVFQTVKHFLDQANSKKITAIKWINDVMIDFDKVSGVLIKNQMIGQGLYTQIGIGINVKTTPSNLQSLFHSATSLEEKTGSQIKVKNVCEKLLETFVRTFYEKKLDDVKNETKKIYQENLAYLNRDVIIYDFKYEKILGTGVFRGINEFGHAIIQGNQQPFMYGRMKAHHLAL